MKNLIISLTILLSSLTVSANETNPKIYGYWLNNDSEILLIQTDNTFSRRSKSDIIAQGKLVINENNISVLNTPGTIDSDYRGEIKVIIFNHGKDDFLIKNGDRIAQMVLVPVIKMELEETDNLPDTLRGDGGFGSTGK